MFNFAKFKKKKPIERHYIPKHAITAILDILDRGEFNKVPNNLLRYQLWRKIQDALPEVDITAGGWNLDTNNILSPSITEYGSN